MVRPILPGRSVTELWVVAVKRRNAPETRPHVILLPNVQGEIDETATARANSKFFTNHPDTARLAGHRVSVADLLHQELGTRADRGPRVGSWFESIVATELRNLAAMVEERVPIARRPG